MGRECPAYINDQTGIFHTLVFIGDGWFDLQEKMFNIFLKRTVKDSFVQYLG